MSSHGFIGQDAAWREWRMALASDRLHHAWLLAGPKGLGKREFAQAAAASLVGASGYPANHPDVLILSNLPKDDKEARKKADGEAYETKRNISVDQIRMMQQRLTVRPTLGDKRAIIVDSADDLEKSAVNALLKSLEEPPASTVFLLVSHQPGRLLPTVRSRCRVLRFAQLGADEIDAVLRRDMPDADPAFRAAAIEAAQGSPGIALSFVAHKLTALHRMMQRIVREGDPDFTLRGAMADEIGARPPRERMAATLDLARMEMAAALRSADRARQARIIEAHAALTRLSAQAPTYNFDPGLLVMEIGGLLASAAMPRETANRA
ncbi:MAG TPA: DNA polymerase III subunit delta' [Novosphingobium sp.]|nr:DNA polymerase III subunit delta' [Novosphingobium sp.]